MGDAAVDGDVAIGTLGRLGSIVDDDDFLGDPILVELGPVGLLFAALWSVRGAVLLRRFERGVRERL